MYEMGDEEARHNRLILTLVTLFAILAVAGVVIVWALVEWLSAGPGF